MRKLNGLRLRYALIGSIVLFLLVVSMSGSSVFGYSTGGGGRGGHGGHGGGHGGNVTHKGGSGSTVVVHYAVMVGVVVISHVTVATPVGTVVTVVTQAPSGSVNVQVQSGSSGFGVVSYGLVVSALAMFGAAAGFGYYASMFNVPPNVTSSDDLSTVANELMARNLNLNAARNLGRGTWGTSVANSALDFPATDPYNNDNSYFADTVTETNGYYANTVTETPQIPIASGAKAKGFGSITQTLEPLLTPFGVEGGANTQTTQPSLIPFAPNQGVGTNWFGSNDITTAARSRDVWIGSAGTGSTEGGGDQTGTVGVGMGAKNPHSKVKPWMEV